EAEERQLESEALPGSRFQVAGDVPPLLAKLPMRSMIARKRKGARRQRLRKAARLWREPRPIGHRTGHACREHRSDRDPGVAATHHSSRIPGASGARALLQAGYAPAASAAPSAS